jgi:tetratricopeptide (TPR) repeat protein
VIRNFVIAATLVLPTAVFAQPPADASSDFATLTARLEKAVLTDEAATVKEIRAALVRQLEAAPSSPKAPMIRYTIAYGEMRMAFSDKLSAAEQTAGLADAETQLNQAIKADGQFGEAYGLLGEVYGMQIAKNNDLGATLGASVAEAIERALELVPNSPRVAIIRAQGLLHTPAEYGGDPRQAEAELRRAIEIFAKEPADAAWPNWGRFDAHAWLGQTLAARGDTEGARAEYKAALEIAPGNGWVKNVLMAQLK